MIGIQEALSSGLVTNLLHEAVANVPFFGLVLWMVLRQEKRTDRQEGRWEQSLKVVYTMEKTLTEMSSNQAKAQELLSKQAIILDRVLDRMDRQDKTRVG